MFTDVAIGAVIGGTVYASTHKPDKFKIEDCLSDMGDGFVDGYAISGALSGVKGLVSFAKSWVKTGETTAKYTEVVSEGGSGSNRLYWGNWDEYKHVMVDGQEYAQIGDRLYSWHAVERMQPSGNIYGSNIYQASFCPSCNYGRSIAPQYVEDVINSAKPVLQENGNYSYISGSLQVITNSRGDVVTVITK